MRTTAQAQRMKDRSSAGGSSAGRSSAGRSSASRSSVGRSSQSRPETADSPTRSARQFPGRVGLWGGLVVTGSVVVLVVAGVLLMLPDTQNDPPTSYSYEIVNTFPHDPQAFCQGLLFQDGSLYESTGLYGRSTLRKVDLKTGKPEKVHQLDQRLFGEGLALVNGSLVQVTWKNRIAIIYDLDTFQEQGRRRLYGRGGQSWGLTYDGKQLILSDGSDRLRFVDPRTFKIVRSVVVRANGRSVSNLNELEWINGEVYANVWKEDVIVRIDPRSGRVTGIINLENLHGGHRPEDVLNGIAYDAENDRLFVTGKNWPNLFEIKLVGQDR